MNILYYYNQFSLPNFLYRYGFELLDKSWNNIHGRSIRYVLKKNRDPIPIDKSFIKNLETKADVFNDRLITTEKAIKQFLTDVSNNGKRIVAYGASGQANIMFAKFHITGHHIPYVIDDSPLKIGRMTPWSHIPIKDSTFLREYSPDYIFVTAYTFFDEIRKRNEWFKGSWIIPLPELHVFQNSD